MNLEFSVIAYRRIRDRIRAEDPQIDEQTLADTVEGLTDVHEILAAIVRAALADEALANGLKGRIAEMQDRLDRLQDCAAKRRQIAKEVMIELDIKKITAPDFTVSIRPGMPSLLVIDEQAVPSIYWQPVRPQAQAPGAPERAQTGHRNHRRHPLQSGAGVEREDTVMGFSAKQVQALRRSLNQPARPHARGQWPRALLYRGLVRDLGGQPDLWLRWLEPGDGGVPLRPGAGKPRIIPRGLYRQGAHYGACRRGDHCPRRPWLGRRSWHLAGRSSRHCAQGGRNRCHQAGAGHLRQTVWA